MMIYTTLHNKWLRLLTALFGTLLSATAVNLFIVPQGLYTGGLMGLSQVTRTLLQTYGGISFGSHDIAGTLYLLLNLPILLFAYKTLGRGLVVRTMICTVAYSAFYSMIPIPATPIVEDTLTSCLLGGILSGTGNGLVLTCGCSSGGLDVVGLCLTKRGSRFSVGKFSLSFNAFLYTACAILFSPPTAIFSIIYTYFSAMVLDRTHQQNVTTQVTIVTRADEHELSRFIVDKLDRGVTYWNGVGGYTGDSLHVLSVCLSKYEVEELRHAVHEFDPHAFLVIQEGVRVDGNFMRKVGQ